MRGSKFINWHPSIAMMLMFISTPSAAQDHGNAILKLQRQGYADALGEDHPKVHEFDGRIELQNLGFRNPDLRTTTASDPTPASIARQRFNQVFVKVIVPVTARTPKQDGPVVESWVAEQLKELGESEYFAVTDWVPVCDGLLADDEVDNRVWGGRLDGKHPYCPVGGDIRERENGRLVVRVAGWLPFGGCDANITLPDEPGSRAVGPVQILVGKERTPVKLEERLPYVAVIIAPPPQESRHTAMPNRQ